MTLTCRWCHERWKTKAKIIFHYVKCFQLFLSKQSAQRQGKKKFLLEMERFSNSAFISLSEEHDSRLRGCKPMCRNLFSLQQVWSINLIVFGAVDFKLNFVLLLSLSLLSSNSRLIAVDPHQRPSCVIHIQVTFWAISQRTQWAVVMMLTPTHPSNFQSKTSCAVNWTILIELNSEL